MNNNLNKCVLGILVVMIVFLFSNTIVAGSITVISKPSVASDFPYKDHKMTWVNQCPMCHHENTLKFNPKGTYEGELTCSHCGADYCGVTGKDKHGSGSRAELKPFNLVEKNIYYAINNYSSDSYTIDNGENVSNLNENSFSNAQNNYFPVSLSLTANLFNFVYL